MSEVTGKLTVKGETQSFGANNFRKREVVITTEDSQYPQTIMVEFIQDKTDLMDKFNIGDNLKISYNLNGRAWVNPQGETKYFNSIQGWRVEKVDSASQPQQSAPKPQSNNSFLDDDSDEQDSLPF